MQKKKVELSRGFLVLSLLVIVLIVVVLIVRTYGEIKQAQMTRKEKLTEWVYQHSDRISRKVAREIVDASDQYKNVLLLLSIFREESTFVPSAMSRKEARGLGQVHWRSHKKALTETGICKREKDLFDVEINVRASNLLLVDMLARSDGDIVRALHLYKGDQDGAYTMRILNNYVQLSLLL